MASVKGDQYSLSSEDKAKAHQTSGQKLVQQNAYATEMAL